MLFTVEIYGGARLLWRATVEAEDREGAIREAMTRMETGEGFMGRYGLKHVNGDLRVEVDAVSRG